MKASRSGSASAPPFQVTPRYLIAGVLGWLIPGAGHWLLGYRVRGLVLAATLLGTFWFGESVLAGNMAVTRTVHPIFFSLQAGNGLSAAVAEYFWGEPKHEAGQLARIRKDLPRHLNLGILFCSVSGLLNALLVLHVLDPRTWAGADRSDGSEGLSP